MEILISVIALVLSVASGGFTLYSFLWTAHRDRKQATLDAYNRLQREVFDKLNLYRPSQILEICEDKTSQEYKTLSGYLARIEHFCVGINQKIYDKETFFVLAHGYFDGPQIRNRVEPLIKTKNKNGNTAETFYDDTLKVWSWMEQKAMAGVSKRRT